MYPMITMHDNVAEYWLGDDIHMMKCCLMTYQFAAETVQQDIHYPIVRTI
jgi:hypothetical protein